MRITLILFVFASIFSAFAQSAETIWPYQERNTMAPTEQHQERIADESMQSVDSQQQDHEDDNAPMVHYEPKDYRSWALAERERRQGQGEEAILMSELPSLIPRVPDESDGDYVKRYIDKMNEMTRRGVAILNDQCTGDVAPNVFQFGGHSFDVGPESGITKKENRGSSEWIGSEEAEQKGYEGVPERFLKFEVRKDGSQSKDEAE